MLITTTDLVKRAMAAADMHDDFVTPAQWAYWLTQENLALSIFLARAGWTLNVKTQTVTVTGSESGRFELTSTPLAVVAVHQVGTSNMVRAVEYNNAVDFLRQTVGNSLASKGDPLEYRAIWDQDDDSLVLNFYPEPTAGSVFLVSYIAHPPALTLSSTVSYPLGFEERIVLGMARRALAKEESDASEIVSQLRECERYIEEAVYDRVFAQHSAIRNADYDTRGWTTKVTLPPPSNWFFY